MALCRRSRRYPRTLVATGRSEGDGAVQGETSALISESTTVPDRVPNLDCDVGPSRISQCLLDQVVISNYCSSAWRRLSRQVVFLALRFNTYQNCLLYTSPSPR